jgi:carbon storage regulator CsrA
MEVPAARLPGGPALKRKGDPAMLVLSRRKGDTLIFPELDVALEVLALKGNVARLGIRAPSTITVLRGELAQSQQKFTAMMENGAEDAPGIRMHRIRNWLHASNLAMQLIRRHLEANRVDAAITLIQKVLDDFRRIEHEDDSPDSPGLPGGDVFNDIAGPDHSAGRRGLLVEDSVNERQLLAGYLRTSGFQMETAGDGGAALDYLSCQDRPDFVLLDMQMPHCDGATFLRRIRRNPSFDRLKVFAVSGSSPADWNIPTGPEGVDRWFEKPVDPRLLVREITRELDKPAMKPR